MYCYLHYKKPLNIGKVLTKDGEKKIVDGF